MCACRTPRWMARGRHLRGRHLFGGPRGRHLSRWGALPPRLPLPHLTHANRLTFHHLPLPFKPLIFVAFTRFSMVLFRPRLDQRVRPCTMYTGASGRYRQVSRRDRRVSSEPFTLSYTPFIRGFHGMIAGSDAISSLDTGVYASSGLACMHQVHAPVRLANRPRAARHLQRLHALEQQSKAGGEYQKRVVYSGCAALSVACKRTRILQTPTKTWSWHGISTVCYRRYAIHAIICHPSHGTRHCHMAPDIATCRHCRHCRHCQRPQQGGGGSDHASTSYSSTQSVERVQGCALLGCKSARESSHSRVHESDLPLESGLPPSRRWLLS